jgi:hypothetical protein
MQSFDPVSKKELLAAPRLANKTGEGDFTGLRYVWRLLPKNGRAAVHSVDTDSLDYCSKYIKFFGKSRGHHITLVSESHAASNIWNMTLLAPLIDEAYDGCNLESFFGLHMLEATDFVPHSTCSGFPLKNFTKELRARAKAQRESKQMAAIWTMLPPPIIMNIDPVDRKQLESGRGELIGASMRKPTIEMQQPNFEAFVKLYLDVVRCKRGDLEAQTPKGPWFYTLKSGKKEARFLQVGSQPEPLTLANLQAIYRRIRIHSLMFLAMFDVFDMRTFGLQTAPNGQSLFGFLGEQLPGNAKLKVTAPPTVFGDEACLAQPSQKAKVSTPSPAPKAQDPVAMTDEELEPRPPTPEKDGDVDMKSAEKEEEVPVQHQPAPRERRPSKPNLVLPETKKLANGAITEKKVTFPVKSFFASFFFLDETRTRCLRILPTHPSSARRKS